MAARMAAAGDDARRECLRWETADDGTIKKIAFARRFHEPFQREPTIGISVDIRR